MLPAAKTQQPAEPTANVGFGDLRFRGQFSGIGVGFKVCFPRNTDEYKNLSGVVSVGRAKKGGIEQVEQTDSTKDLKHKFALWIRGSTMDIIGQKYRADNCSSKSEFIEKAVLFYAGYLDSNSSEEYVSKMLASILKSIIEESDNRIGRLIFKLAVELAMTMNIIAATHDIDELSLEKLRGECVKEVKKRNGNFSFDDAVKWQKG